MTFSLDALTGTRGRDQQHPLDEVRGTEDDIRQAGYDAGYSYGYERGREDAEREYEVGYCDGRKDAESEYEEDLDWRTDEAYDEGHSEGYSEGVTSAKHALREGVDERLLPLEHDLYWTLRGGEQDSDGFYKVSAFTLNLWHKRLTELMKDLDIEGTYRGS